MHVAHHVTAVVGGLVVLIGNAGQIPEALGIIFTDAFTGTSAAGGFIGSSIATSASRKLCRPKRSRCCVRRSRCTR